MKRSIKPVLSACCLALALPVAAECPPAEEILRRIEALGLERSSRTARYDVSTPESLYVKAAQRVGEPYARRQGDNGLAVIVAAVPIEQVWKSLNDLEQHKLDGGFVPLKHSEVIEGGSGSESRVLFQYFQQMGVSRWWVSRLSMNAELYRQTGGQLWELTWEDRTDEVDPEKPPMSTVSGKMTAIRDSQGAWLLAPISAECTMIEHFSRAEPGGMAGVLQPLVLKRALRNTVEGLVRMARNHAGEPHPDHRFIRPDGSVLD